LLTFKFQTSNTFKSLQFNQEFGLVKHFMFSFVIIIWFPNFAKIYKTFAFLLFDFTFYFLLSFLPLSSHSLLFGADS